jgi:ChrR Cupin-like domain
MRSSKHQNPVADTPGVPTQSSVIWRRVVERIADADVSHLTVHFGDGEWKPFVAGVAIKALHKESGVLSYLLRLAPGATLPPHRHPQDEECLVLEGRLRVGTTVEVGPGGYHRAHRGALHPTISTVTGATIFLRGAVPHASHLLD